MSNHLCITVRWIGDRFHGFVDGTEMLEWPPSPFRLFQALIAGANRYGLNATKRDALRWIERQRISPDILASPQPSTGIMFDHWVPDNDDLQNHRRGSIRKFCPTLLEAHRLVHYVWPIDLSDPPPLAALDELTSTLSSLGWAIDQAYAVVTLASAQEIDAAVVELSRFRPAGNTTSTKDSLRVPKPGSISDLEQVHSANCTASKTQAERRRKRWPKVYNRVLYNNIARPIGRPYRIFELKRSDGRLDCYPHARLIHLAGMLRHLAIEAMKRSAPADVDEDWVETYIAGHARPDAKAHRQLSYLPLPSLGHVHTDPGVRRVMIAAPAGDDPRLDYVARRLAGQILRPKRGDEFGDREPPLLVPVRNDNIARFYTEPAGTWHSVTPVILPGHDDHKPAKTRALIERALRQSGIDQPCAFEWSAFSRFPKCYSAHKYDREKRPQGYIRPDHLPSQTAVHLTLRFHDGSESMNPVDIPGPLVIGAGRHCGFGLMARAFKKGG